MSKCTAALCRLLAPPPDPRDDGDLLAAFVRANDETAFAELIRRHGPLMLSACRRLLPDRCDAEDAFQSAFVVLIRRANRLASLPALGPWLYRVAVLTARNVRRQNARRFARQSVLPDSLPDRANESNELRLDLDAALLRLPEKLRTPIVLCHLQGWSRRDAAQRLGCPEGTLSSLLARGLAKLRQRLGGLDPAKALVVPTLVIPATLSVTTVRAATTALASNAFPLTLSTLAEGVLRMFWIKKATAATMALAVVFGLGVGIGVSVRQVPSVGAADEHTAAMVIVAEPPATPDELARALEVLADAESNKQLDDLKQQIAAAQAELEKAAAVSQLAKAKVELAAKSGTPVTVDKARAELALAELSLLVAKKRYEDLKLALADMETKAKSQPKAKEPANDPDKQIAEAKALLEQLRDQRVQLEQDLRKLQRNALDLDAKSEAVMEQLKLLELKRTKEAKEKTPIPSASGPALVVTIGEERPNVVCTLTEYGTGGKAVGTLTCDNADILRLTLTRAMKDPAAPKELRIAVTTRVKYEIIVKVLEACKAAGFKEVNISGLIQRPVESPRGLLLDDQIVLEKFDNITMTIDRLLEKFPPVKP